MPLRRALRERAFRLARRDIAAFIADHEEDLLVIFHEEITNLDDRLPDESLFIDIKMAPLGEAILRAALDAIRRFLTEELPTSQGKTIPQTDPNEKPERSLTLRDSSR